MKKSISCIFLYVFLGAWVIVSVFPFIWTLFAMTQSTSQIMNSQYSFTIGSDLKNNLLGLQNAMPVWNNLLNSIFIAVVYTALVLLIDSMAGYAFAKYQFPGKNLLFILCLATMMIPVQVIMVPIYIQLTNLHFVDSLWSVVLTSLSNVLGVFLMRQNMSTFPNSLIEAARIDGSGEFMTFLRIVMPTMRPALTSLGILSFVNQWGNYYIPLILLNTEKKYTLPLMLAILSAPNYNVDYGAIMLGAAIAFLPVLIFFFIAQNNIIDGMIAGAIKG